MKPIATKPEKTGPGLFDPPEVAPALDLLALILSRRAAINSNAYVAELERTVAAYSTAEAARLREADDALLTVREVADLTGISTVAVAKWPDKHNIGAKDPHKNIWLFSKRKLYDYLLRRYRGKLPPRIAARFAGQTFSLARQTPPLA